MSAPRGLAWAEALARLNDLGKRVTRAQRLLWCVYVTGHAWAEVAPAGRWTHVCARCGERGRGMP